MILLDATPLVALCDNRDALHEPAIRHLGQLARTPFATCDAVLTETCFHLPYRSQRLRLRDLLDELNVAVLPASFDGPYRREVFGWLERYAEHEPDWADGCIAVLCGRDVSMKVWTYDAEFSTTWRRPDGSRIPLAVK